MACIVKINKKIKKGVKALVLVGKDKGKEAVIVEVIRRDATVKLSGINLAKKHVKPENNSAGVVLQEMPVHVSNVLVLS
ncbi:MAG: 50S ribosomal protein L24 [Rickettsiaceae bacterium]|nr:50S ribosomal protein L24 [Rickettsiaceae bacterium]